MENTRTEIPAVHEWHLEKVLSDLGMLDALTRGEVLCRMCGRVVTLESVGALIVGHDKSIAICCDLATCLEQATDAGRGA
jgi:hypothetical protein